MISYVSMNAVTRSKVTDVPYRRKWSLTFFITYFTLRFVSDPGLYEVGKIEKLESFKLEKTSNFSILHLKEEVENKFPT